MRFVKTVLLCLCAYFILRCAPALAEQLSVAEEGWQAGTFWADIRALDAGEPMRLWLSFIRTDTGSLDPEFGQILPDDMTVEEIRLGMLGMYSQQMQLLGAANVIPADEMKLYIVDPDFMNALAIEPLVSSESVSSDISSEYPQTLGGVWRLAQGHSSLSALDRTFAGKQNPMGILRSSLAAYLRRTSYAGTSNLSASEIDETSKEQYAAQSAAKQTGIILLLAPEGEVSPPAEVEIRYPVSQYEASLSLTKPKNHTAEKLATIAAASEIITQMRVKSGVFLDIRLYNNDKQLTFKQKTGKSESGVCLDLILYGKPKDFANLTLGMTGAAKARLAELGVQVVHICIASTDSSAYKEYWREISL
jgi:hypothetical protein